MKSPCISKESSVFCLLRGIFFLGLFFDHEDRGAAFIPKDRVDYNRLFSVITEQRELFISIAVRTLKPIRLQAVLI